MVTCIAGGLLGWPFAGLAAVPIGLRALAHIGFLPVLTDATAAACSLVIASLGVDSQMYGQVTVRTPFHFQVHFRVFNPLP